MKTMIPVFASIASLACPAVFAADAAGKDGRGLLLVNTSNGTLEGTVGKSATVRAFKGIPYAEAPVGDQRWKPPQPLQNWIGVRKATDFGAHCIQARLFAGGPFGDKAESEDCLFLNVWTPARTANQNLPVMVWIHGGGFVDGASSELRYDGENLAKKGVVLVSINYRLGIFGFYAHPELSRESELKTSGDYGFLDQVAALRWVGANIAAFGGNPKNVTIAGESAGSLSVSALMVSPLAEGLFQKAIGESGAFFYDKEPGVIQTLSELESAGSKFAKSVNAASIADMRKIPADELSKMSIKALFPSTPSIDGYFLTARVNEAFAAGRQARVPLLAGWNADEGKALVLGSRDKLTAGGFKFLAALRFGLQTGEFLKLYPASNDQEAFDSAAQLAGDDFAAYGTWKWIEFQAQSGQSPVYRYHFEQNPPNQPGARIGQSLIADMGCMHTAELDYVFDNLDWHDVPVTPTDRILADSVSSYWVNFARNGDPNGSGLPKWPEYSSASGRQVMHLVGDSSHAAPEDDRARYEFLDARAPKPK